MAKKIAKIDADAMDGLYASEFQRMAGTKVAFDQKIRMEPLKLPRHQRAAKNILKLFRRFLRKTPARITTLTTQYSTEV